MQIALGRPLKVRKASIVPSVVLSSSFLYAEVVDETEAIRRFHEFEEGMFERISILLLFVNNVKSLSTFFVKHSWK